MPEATLPRLSELKAGDFVAVHVRGTLADSPWQFNRMERVTKVTPKRIRCGVQEYDRATGHIVGRGSTFIRVPTDRDRETHAAQVAERRRRDAEEKRIAALRQTPELQAVRAIVDAFDIEFSGDDDSLYALARQIGLPALQEFAAKVAQAQEPTR